MKIDFDNASPSLQNNESQQPAITPVRSVTWLKSLTLWGAVAFSLGLGLNKQFDHTAEQQILALQAQVRVLEQTSATQQQALMHHEQLLASQYAATLEHMFERSANPDSFLKVSQVLQDQEKDLQKITLAMKSGMQDLANMLPGSRGWVHYYAEQLDDVVRNSRKRDEALRALAVPVR